MYASLLYSDEEELLGAEEIDSIHSGGFVVTVYATATALGHAAE